MKFSELELHPLVAESIEANKFVDCTPIQEASIPIVLQGKDLAGLAQTGTGKTAAFALPLIDRLVRSREPVAEGARADRPIFADWRKTNFILVLVPTRELAEQVYENVVRLGQFAKIRAVAIYGGISYEPQKAAIKQGVDFIVATPGRLIDLYKEHQVDLSLVRAIVFDEADRMFDMGFKDDMKFILQRVPRDRQLLVFSATLNFDVLNTAYEFGADPVEVNVSRDQAKADNVQDEIFHVGQDEKPKFLYSLLQKHQPKQTIIFSNFKHNVERIAKFLSQNGVPAMGISSLISQSQRTRIMELFRAENNDRNVLVATDVAARGLDIKGVDMVINFELPDDAENYVHRIGRTGRAGAKGCAISLVSDRDVEALQRIESYLGHKVTIGWIDEADVVKDLKDFPRDESRRRPEFKRDDRGGRPGGGGQRSGGGHGGPRRDHPGDRSGRRHEAGDRGGRHRQDGPRAEGARSHERRPDADGGKPGQSSQHKSQPRAAAASAPAKWQNIDGKWSRVDSKGAVVAPHQGGHKSKFSKNQNQQRGGYKHKYSQGATANKSKSAQGGIVGKVSGFFKKLLGG